jgi:hypothetical protein
MAEQRFGEVAMSSAKRKTIPPSVRHQVIMEAGFKCGNPACRNIITLQLHHIHWVKEDGGNVPENLLPLCGYCHDQHTHGHITPDAIRLWKGLLLALNQAFDRAGMDLLLYLWETREQEIWYTGDGLLRFSGLIAAGLVEFATKKLYGQTPTNVGQWGDMPMLIHGSSYETGMVVEVRLSQKGKLLVEAWRGGDEEKYREIIRVPKDAGNGGAAQGEREGS